MASEGPVFRDLDPQKLRFPPPLRPGDDVGIIAPAFPTASWYPSRFQHAISCLSESLFVKPVVAQQASNFYDGIVAGTAIERAEALNEFMLDPNIKAIFCTIGGFSSAEILPYLDPAIVDVEPKIVVGYSDCTSLLLGIQAAFNWVTYYGPAVMTQFGEFPEPHAYTVTSFTAMTDSLNTHITVEPPSGWTKEFLDWGTDAWRERPRKMVVPAQFKLIAPGVGSGTLFGGNLETLNFLVGTDHLAVPTDIVLFWEVTEAEASLPRVRRALTHLAQSGILERTRAMLIGRSSDSPPFRTDTFHDTILQSVRDLDFPVVADFPIGHTDPITTIPIGAHAKVIADINGEPHISIGGSDHKI